MKSEYKILSQTPLNYPIGQPVNMLGLMEASGISDGGTARKVVEQQLIDLGVSFPLLSNVDLLDEHSRPVKNLVLGSVVKAAKRHRTLVVYAAMRYLSGKMFLCYHDEQGVRRWLKIKCLDQNALTLAFEAISEYEGKDILILPIGDLVRVSRLVVRSWLGNCLKTKHGSVRLALEVYNHSRDEIEMTVNSIQKIPKSPHLTHLDRLEAESIHIIREVMAEAKNPVMLYSVGKDSSVMLQLARKAFYPSPPPFPLLHVDTRWKFKSMYDFRDYMASKSGMDLLVHINQDGVDKNINPLDHGSALHTDIMKTQSLKQALNHYKFDVAFGGARRDEEKSRAKERVFSFRSDSHQWDPKNQRPELWNLYNGKKRPQESIRVFPISNWTELDIWQYIYREQIPIVPLYFAADRPVVERDGMIMMVDDDRLKILPGEEIKIKQIRFRTLGCYPLTGAIESDADNLAKIVLELLSAKTSERQGRAIDSDTSASMEKKKQEGYF